MSLIQRILCPVDFSEASAKALAYAERLAQSLGAEVVLLHAFEVPEKLGLLGQDRPADAEVRPQLEAVQLS